MKGVIQAYAFFVLWISLSLSFMAFIRFDHHQYINRFILRQALNETSLLLEGFSDQERIEYYEQILYEALMLRKPKALEYDVSIMGFHTRPLVLRVRLALNLKHELMPLSYVFDETIIEVKDEN
jgi:hypothetical protein